MEENINKIVIPKIDKDKLNGYMAIALFITLVIAVGYIGFVEHKYNVMITELNDMKRQYAHCFCQNVTSILWR